MSMHTNVAEFLKLLTKLTCKTRQKFGHTYEWEGVFESLTGTRHDAVESHNHTNKITFIVDSTVLTRFMWSGVWL